MNDFKILSLDVDNLTYESVISYLNMAQNTVVISSVNPEICLICEENIELRNIINRSELKIADGIGVVNAVKSKYNVSIQRVTGIDLMTNILASNLGAMKTYLYGSKEGVASLAASNIASQYEHVNIVGTTSGYEKDNEKIITAINESDAELLFVGLGCPMQDYWIEANKSRLPKIKVFMVVGGSFDVLSGNIKRAPNLFVKLNLEWFYRLLVQPSRIKRQFSLLKFLMKTRK